MPPAKPAILPTVFYKDPIAALRWLEDAFGFETTSLVTDADGRVGYSEMAYLGSAISVGGEWSGPQLGGGALKSPASLEVFIVLPPRADSSKALEKTAFVEESAFSW